MNYPTTAQVDQPRCRGQPKAPGERAPLHPTAPEGSIMIRSIVTAVAVASIALLGATAAQATEVTSQSSSEESHQKTSREGTSAAAEDHMSNDGPGIVQGEGTSGTLQVVGFKPVFDKETGEQIFKEDGVTPVMQAVWGWVPFSTGPAPAVIVHN